MPASCVVVKATLAALDEGFLNGTARMARALPARRTTGLGLDIARRSVLGWGGTFRTGTAPEGGALVVLELPIHS